MAAKLASSRPLHSHISVCHKTHAAIVIITSLPSCLIKIINKCRPGACSCWPWRSASLGCCCSLWWLRWAVWPSLPAGSWDACKLPLCWSCLAWRLLPCLLLLPLLLCLPLLLTLWLPRLLHLLLFGQPGWTLLLLLLPACLRAGLFLCLLTRRLLVAAVLAWTTKYS